MEEAEIHLWRVELLGDIEYRYLPSGEHGAHSLGHVAENGRCQRVAHLLAEVDGCISAQPLVGAEEAGGVLPAGVGMGAEHELLRDGVLLLPLDEL